MHTYKAIISAAHLPSRFLPSSSSSSCVCSCVCSSPSCCLQRFLNSFLVFLPSPPSSTTTTTTPCNHTSISSSPVFRLLLGVSIRVSIKGIPMCFSICVLYVCLVLCYSSLVRDMTHVCVCYVLCQSCAVLLMYTMSHVSYSESCLL